ncbi:hypothetical protein J3R82DRAFT_9243 [Butyriboletus roseoflavus]|nr:hypothetical protein J3R82DRAFT_9243 [Butyriboletus roseoflavus]
MNASVDDLKDAIKVAYHGGDLENVTPDRLKLYKISANEEAELREHLCSLGSGRLLQGHEWVERVFDDVPFFQTPRVVIELDAKRDHPEDPFEANKRIRHKFATLPMQTPSIIAMPCYFQEHYEKNHEPHIRCGRPGENHSPFPLVLAHRIFVTFVSECETYEPNDEDLTFILKLSQCMSQFFGAEKDRRTLFRACMREYGINLTEAKIEGTEYMTDRDARVGTLPYLISEAKKDFGVPPRRIHISRRLRTIWLPRNIGFARNPTTYAPYPTFTYFTAVCTISCYPVPAPLIWYVGPVLGFAGSMLTEEFDVNVLGPILPLFYHPTDIDMQIRCAKMFGALKNSAAALKEYYEHTMPQSLADTLFPWVTQYDTVTSPTETREYKYLSRMDGGHLLYICQHIDSDKKRILVKFVRTYSKDAHLASAAPALLGHRDIPSCGWSVVVMELLEEPDLVSGVKIFDKDGQRMVSDKVREHVSALHQQGFVHGDIRAQNILVRRPDAGHGDSLSVRLVDFDWAGETNKAKYPFFVNPDIGCGFKRPSGVKGGGVITMEHDLAMIDLMYAHAT